MTIKEINNLIVEGQSLKQITQVFTQIASVKLKRIRAGVERNRDFFAELSLLFGIVNTIAEWRKIKLPKKNGKTLSILLSSNERFYGRITNELLEFFIIQSSKIPSDKVVIGKAAIDTLKSMNYVLSHTDLFFRGDFPSNAELLSLGNVIKHYSKILVFYPKFQSVLTQVPTITDITGSQQQMNAQNSEAVKMATEYFNFIVEPEIQTIAEFFDSQIKILLLETAFLEAELARTASRLIAMDRAQNEAEKYLDSKELLLLNAKRSIANARILEMVAGISGNQKGR